MAGGERVLVVVGDVARRRPLLSRDVLTGPPEGGAAYVQPACAGRLEAAVAGTRLVLTSYELLAARPQAAAAFDHVVLLDPPFTQALLAAVAAWAPQGWIHALWSPADALFAGTVAAAELDLDPVMRRVWRALSAGSGRFDEALELELLQGEPFLHSAGAVCAAVGALRDAGLLHVDDSGGYHLERPQSKVDVTQTDTFHTWHTLFRTSNYLRTCLTSGL